ncbi:DUF305 domain-containing protein (plasmid) [Sulfitobacter alexandrii]|uniref:DUF305 domain-containing protein n=1 Tax=Sulfitobacter alexandrii TaxID=1917485 RepID=A0A1J0WN30_9RHOB|nr:DUF305 domain-containing protein [Sulfitobacter alexandrii]APE45764.1 DUF305 domain-containing protein [Sulfitobacter alexandrii]
MSYGRFFAMIATSTVVMFGLMYLNTYLWTHVFWSETRAYMALLMGATMAIIMLGFMLSMYSSKMANATIFIGAAVVFAASLWLVRSQVTVGDTSYMRAMIPHHSIAIMTSSRADISDPRVRKLADEIIYAQDKEIAEMRYLVNDIDANGDSPAQSESGPTQIMSLDEALSTPEVAILDLEFLTTEDIAQMFPGGAACTFTYTTTSRPALAVGRIDGGSVALAKISGDLVRLEAGDAGSTWGTEGMTVALSAPSGPGILDANSGEMQDADLVLELGSGLRAGYRGYYGCGA